jgi:hypothetical protein
MITTIKINLIKTPCLPDLVCRNSIKYGSDYRKMEVFLDTEDSTPMISRARGNINIDTTYLNCEACLLNSQSMI